jgi:hypothetical protein
MKAAKYVFAAPVEKVAGVVDDRLGYHNIDCCRLHCCDIELLHLRYSNCCCYFFAKVVQVARLHRFAVFLFEIPQVIYTAARDFPTRLDRRSVPTQNCKSGTTFEGCFFCFFVFFFVCIRLV